MYDEPVAVPIVDFYDTDMMKTYLAAAKGEYERAYQEQKDFAKEFGGLYSPSSTLNKAYYDATRGKVQQAMDYLYQNGIDPLRSQEGRAYIAKIIREIPYADIANYKQSAENMKTYQKAAAQMLMKGDITRDQLDWQMQKQGLNYDKYDPISGNWDVLSPTKMESITDLTKTQYSMLKPKDLTKQEVEGLGYTYDPNQKYTGITQEMLQDTAFASLPSLLTTETGKYQYDKAKEQLQEMFPNTNITDYDIEKRMANNIAGQWQSKLVATYEPDKYKLLDYQAQKDLELYSKKADVDVNTYKQKAQIDQEYPSSKGAGGKSGEITIFDVAKSNPKQSAGLSSESNLDANGVAFGESVQVTRYAAEKGKPSYTSIKFNTRDQGVFVLKKDTKEPYTVSSLNGKDIKATVSGNLTYFPELKCYAVKCILTEVDGHKKIVGNVKHIWVPVSQTVKTK